jgi:hypothetical protein
LVLTDHHDITGMLLKVGLNTTTLTLHSLYLYNYIFLGTSTLLQCVSCTAGYYCEQAGNDTVTGECMAGYYCTGGASIPNPTSEYRVILFIIDSHEYLLPD